MIGELTLPGGQRAVLTDTGHWRATEAHLAHFLQTHYSPLEEDSPYTGPAAGAFGVAALVAAGKFLKARVKLARPAPKSVSGRIH